MTLKAYMQSHDPQMVDDRGICAMEEYQKMKKTFAARARVRNYLLTGMSLAAAISGLPAHSYGDEPVVLPEVQVQGQTVNPAVFSLDPRYTDVTPYADGGEFLRAIPGVSSGRIGGHGLEPVIRGQQQNRLNVIGDGAFQYGACPNRMDPPTSISGFEAYDEIIVERGYQTVTNGPGGSGGTVSMKRTTPDFPADRGYQGSVSGGVNSNGSLKETAINLASDLGEGYARFNGGIKDAGDYKDGGNNKVRSSFEQRSGTLELGWRPSQDTVISISQQMERSSDVLFAGAGMDTPDSETDATRLSLKHQFNDEVLQGIDISTFSSFTNHLMDNYSLRSWSMMTMKTESTSDTVGGRVAADLDIGGVDLTTGMDFQHNTRDATRYRGSSIENVETAHAYMWPDLALMQTGLFAEGTTALGEASQLTLGARYDYVQADADKVDKVANPTGAISRSANDLYALYYGKRMDNVTEHNLGGLMRFDQDWAGGLSTHATLSRSVRTADATERGMAGDHGTASSRWIGNPDISPEKHHQVELGVAADISGWSIGASAYHDWVSDYIFRDSARGQDGILLSDNATIYRNVDAKLWGLEIGANTRFVDYWVLGVTAAYTHGKNDDTGRPLPQIPPLSATLDLAYDNHSWTVGTRIDAALKQNRVDDDTSTGSGLDVQKTAGYVVPSLYATYRGLDPVNIRFGITNLLDRTYANHLNRSNSFDSEQTQVNEPGRSFYLQVRADF